MTPVEFHYAIKISNEVEGNKAQLLYEIAQYQVFHIWNSSGRLRTALKKIQDVGKFPWQDKGLKVQTLEEMRSEMQAIVGAFANNKGVRPSEKRKLRMKR